MAQINVLIAIVVAPSRWSSVLCIEPVYFFFAGVS